MVTTLLLVCACYSWAMDMSLEDLHGKRLKKREVTELLADKRWKEDQALTKFFGEARTYVHPDKSVVLSVDWNGKGGMLFLDKDAVYRTASTPDALRPRHMLQGIFQYGEDFRARSDALSKKFFEKMRSEVNGSFEPSSVASLSAVDEFVATKGAKAFLQPDLFVQLLAYVGNVLRKEYSLEWSMNQVGEGIWEPWLIDNYGNKYPIFAAVYRELYEYTPGHSSIAGTVVGEIKKTRLLGSRRGDS